MPTVFGVILKANSKPYAGSIAFQLTTNSLGDYGLNTTQRQLGKALADGNAVIDGEPFSVKVNAAGYFSTPLVPGQYIVYIGANNRDRIAVPDSQSDLLLQELLGVTGATNPAVGYNFQTVGSARQLLNSTNGAWHVFYMIGEPTVPGAYRFGFSADGADTDLVNTRERSGMFEIWSPTDDTWHAPYLSNGRVTYAADGSTPFQNRRINGGIEQLYDIKTKLWRTWYVSGATSQETLAFGPETA